MPKPKQLSDPDYHGYVLYADADGYTVAHPESGKVHEAGLDHSHGTGLSTDARTNMQRAKTWVDGQLAKQNENNSG
jgi:hypothetical protein